MSDLNKNSKRFSEYELVRSVLGNLWSFGFWLDDAVSRFDDPNNELHGCWTVESESFKHAQLNVYIDNYSERVIIFGSDCNEYALDEMCVALGDPDLVGKVHSGVAGYLIDLFSWEVSSE